MLPPLQRQQWDLQKAAHLLNRAGFGGPPGTIEALYTLGFQSAVESLLDFKDDAALFPLPDFKSPASPFALAVEPWLDTPLETATRLKTPQIQNYEQIQRMRTWWLDRMQRTPNPLREKMTLFWHGHFATGFQKVNDAFLMWQQNELFREHALGNFGGLVKAVSRDPAMMIYLDLHNSNKAHPNENFARELMELFTLGIGHYTEQDIQQAARTFTGYRIDPVDKCSFQFNGNAHDDGVKTFMGEQENFVGDWIIDKILAQPACAKFIVRKLWKFFAFEHPADALVERLAAAFRDGNYELRPLMREIFSCAEFYSAETMFAQIKSPVQWAVQTARSLEMKLPLKQVLFPLQQMGQVLFAPPNVKGWDGGPAWINTQTLLARYNLSQTFLSSGGQPDERLNLQKIAPPALRADPKNLVTQLALRLFQRPPDAHAMKSFTGFLEAQKPPVNDETIRNLLHVMMSTPQFQLC